jgi:hypothetical protein
MRAITPIFLMAIAGGTLAAASAQAAPFAGPAAELKGAARGASAVGEVGHRRCWRRKGRTICRSDETRRRDEGDYDSGRVKRQPQYYSEFLPFGSQLWWQQKERESGER